MAIQTISSGATTLGAPSGGDSIILLGGSGILVTNMDWSATSGVASVEINSTFNGSFGTTGAPFIAECTGTFWYGASGGDSFWESRGTGVDPDVSIKLIMPRGSQGSMNLVTSGTWTDVMCAGGVLNINTGPIVTNLYLASNSVCRFLDSGDTDPTLIENLGGSLILDRGATTLNHHAGSSVIQGVAANAITTLNCFGSGVQIVDSGTITTANCLSAIPDASRLSRALTISNTNINMTLPGAEDFLNHGLITHSSTTKYLGR